MPRKKKLPVDTSYDSITAILSRLKTTINIETDTKLASELGMPLRRLQTWKQRGTVPYKPIIDYCILHTLSIDFILTGRPGPVHNDVAGSSIDGTAAPHHITPPAGRIGGMDITGDQIVDTLSINPEWLKYSAHIDSKNFYIVRIIGNNMSPWATDGDLVLIDVSQDVIVTDTPYVLEYDGLLVVKRLVRQADGTILARSDSTYCEDEIYQPEMLPKIIGRIVRRLVR